MTEKHSGVIFWDLKTFQPLYDVKAHKFTIFDIKLSKDLMLTVSKDRQIAMYKVNPESKRFELVCKKEGHTRQIFSVSIRKDNKGFVTGGKDKKVK